MAKVPLYQTGEVAQKSLPEARQTSIASPELFAGISGAKGLSNFGEGLTYVGLAGMKYANDLQEKENTAVVQNQIVDMMGKNNEFELTAKQLQGLNASSLPTQAEEHWSKTVEDAMANMNDRQKYAFKILADRQKPSFISGINAHAATQLNKAQEDSFKSSLEAYQSSAAANPASAELMRNETKRTVEAWSQIKGLDAATKDRAMSLELTKLHANVVVALETQGKASEARAYFEKYIDEIAGDKRDEIKKVFEASDKMAKSQAFADDVDARKLTLEQALAEARAKFDGEEEKNVVAEIKTRFVEKDAIKQQAEEADFGTAWKLAIDDGRGMKGIPSVIYARLTPAHKNAIENEVYQRGRRYADGAGSKTDQLKWHDIQQQSWKDPQAFIKRDLRMDKQYLSDSDFQELSKMQASVKKDIDSPEKLKRVFSVGQQINQTIDSIGIPATSNNKETRDRRAQATRAVSDALTREAAAMNKDVDQLTEDEVQKVTDKVLIKGKTSSGWFGTEKYAFELKPDEVAGFRIPDRAEAEKAANYMTAKEKAEVRKALIANGAKAPTEAQIRETYIKARME